MSRSWHIQDSNKASAYSRHQRVKISQNYHSSQYKRPGGFEQAYCSTTVCVFHEITCCCFPGIAPHFYPEVNAKERLNSVSFLDGPIHVLGFETAGEEEALPIPKWQTQSTAMGSSKNLHASRILMLKAWLSTDSCDASMYTYVHPQNQGGVSVGM